MQPFTYQFKGNSCNAHFVPFKVGMYQRYLITLGTGVKFTIAPSGIPGSNDKVIWVQSNKPGEFLQPHDLVQAIGEGLQELPAHS